MRRTRGAARWGALILPLLLMVFLSLSPVRASAFPPTVVLGLYGSSFWLDSVLPELGLTASALAGWRNAFHWGGSLALNADAAVTYAPPGTEGIYDRESLGLQLYAPLGGLRLEVETGLSASGLGTQEGLLPYLRPSWSVAGRWLGEGRPVRPFVEAPGYALLEFPGEETAGEEAVYGEDAIYQGGVLGVALAPSFESSYEISAGAGWQRWLEVPRDDVLARLHFEGEWLLGYFATGGLSAEGGLRWSNATGESRWFTRVDASLSWSPRRQLGLQVGGYSLGEWYIDRALSPLDGRLTVLTGGLDLRLDWTPDDRWYFVLDASALGSWSQDPTEQGGNLRLQAGVELSL